MAGVRTEIEIAAPPERIWHVLADLDAYPLWNPYLLRVDGRLKTGERLQVLSQPPGGRAATHSPLIVKVEPFRELRWLGRPLRLPYLLDGEHAFTIEPLGPKQACLVQSENFSGLLALIYMWLRGGRTRRGFEAMNQALKARAERAAAPAGAGPKMAPAKTTRPPRSVKPAKRKRRH